MNQRLAELFEYADGKLLWKHSRGRRQAGQEAGCVAQIGRMYVQVDGKKHLVHRVIWFLHYGNCPEFLDHIDGNPLNNKIENLRPATKQQNAMNRKIRCDNSTGFKGIYQLPSKKFAASICVNGKNNYLGVFKTPELAQAAYIVAATNYFKEYARV
jgi:hypothetical protein